MVNLSHLAVVVTTSIVTRVVSRVIWLVAFIHGRVICPIKNKIPKLFYFLFTKICVSKNPLLQTPGTLDILATPTMAGSQSPLEAKRVRRLIKFSPPILIFLLLHLQLFLRLPSFSSVRCFLRVAAQNEVEVWIQDAACCSEGGIY